MAKEVGYTSKDTDRVSITIKELSEICSDFATKTAPKSHSEANPGPLGLAGFAMTTFCLSVFNARWISPELEAEVLPLALWYGGVAQFIAGVWELKVGNTFGATAFCSYGAFWVSFATYVKFVVADLNPDIAHQATGLFLLSWTIFTGYMCLAVLSTFNALILVFYVLEIAFILLTIGAFTQNENLTKAGGYFGVTCAFLAWYCSAGLVFNTTWRKNIFPLGHHFRPDGSTPKYFFFG